MVRSNHKEKEMARKVDYTFEAQIELNEDKGGAWLATCCKGYMDEEGQFIDELTIHTPWKNAAAAKRWVKAKVLELTPRKSVKMEPVKIVEVNGKEKPARFHGKLTFKG